jgi:hypothetical protein
VFVQGTTVRHAGLFHATIPCTACNMPYIACNNTTYSMQHTTDNVRFDSVAQYARPSADFQHLCAHSHCACACACACVQVWRLRSAVLLVVGDAVRCRMHGQTRGRACRASHQQPAARVGCTLFRVRCIAMTHAGRRSAWTTLRRGQRQAAESPGGRRTTTPTCRASWRTRKCTSSRTRRCGTLTAVAAAIEAGRPALTDPGGTLPHAPLRATVRRINANALVGRCPDDRNDPRRVLCQHGDHTDKARPEKVRRADCIPSRSNQRGRCSRSQRATFPHCKRATLQQSTCNVTAIRLPHASSTCNVQQFDNRHATYGSCAIDGRLQPIVRPFARETDPRATGTGAAV